jgi:hypothetical protein
LCLEFISVYLFKLTVLVWQGDGKCGFPKLECSEEYAASPGLQFYFRFRDGALLYKMVMDFMRMVTSL